MTAMLDTAWSVDALCAQVGGDVWFPEKGQPTEPAKRICRGCPVRAQCLAYALAEGITYGVWGGASPNERRALANTQTSPARAAARFVAGQQSEGKAA